MTEKKITLNTLQKKQKPERANDDIRQALKEAKMHMWQLAEYFNVSDNTLFKWFRHELDPETKEEILEFIADCKKEQEA